MLDVSVVMAARRDPLPFEIVGHAQAGKCVSSYQPILLRAPETTTNTFSNNMAQPFIGSRITLISVSQIRYEGILNAVDQQEATVSLQDVQMFG